MNWKDCPQLFCNGKFKFQVGETTGDFISYATYGSVFLEGDGYSGVVEINDCTLIARPIESMTDEEWSKLHFPKGKNRIKWFEITTLMADDLLYLLSIGVYPFDQDSKHVIWSSKMNSDEKIKEATA